MPDSRIIILFPNRVNGAVLWGGAYVEAMPLDNLKDRQLSRIARTIDLLPSSTWFALDFGRQRSIRGFAFVNHTFSFASRIRARAANVPDFSVTVYDKTEDTWAAVAGDWNIDELEWEADNYWLGTFSPEEVEGQTPTSARILGDMVQARYWRFDIIDPQNDAGHLDIGRLFIGDGFLQPRYNMSYGAQSGYETATKVETSLGGAEYFDRRESLRVIRFDLGLLSDDEGFGQALELMRRAGIDGEVFVIPDPTDTVYGPQRSFLGRFRQLNLLEQAMYQLNSMSFEIKELR